jgi:hypothetical protein
VTLTNCYATTSGLSEVLGIDDPYDDVRMEAALNASSRQIDAHCGRRFWQDSTVVARTYYVDDEFYAEVDDISTTTGLIVKIDSSADGTFATTLTITTDFVLGPLNAAAEVPVRPYDTITAVGNYSFPMVNRRAGLSVTAKFGWPAVPDDVAQACLVQAKNLYKAPAGTLAGYQMSSGDGIVTRIPGLDGVAIALLETYRKVRVG